MRRLLDARSFSAEPRRDWISGLLLLSGLFLALSSLLWTMSKLPLLMGLSIAAIGLAEFLPARQHVLVRTVRIAGTLGVILTFVGGVLWLLLFPESFLAS